MNERTDRLTTDKCNGCFSFSMDNFHSVKAELQILVTLISQEGKNPTYPAAKINKQFKFHLEFSDHEPDEFS